MYKRQAIQGNGDTSSNAHPIGIYAQSSTALAVNETVDINRGSGAMNVSGKNGIGIYICLLYTSKQWRSKY